MRFFFILFTAVIASNSKLIDDPRAYVVKSAEFPERGFQEFRQKFGTKDAVFIAPLSDCGTGGCGYYIFFAEGGKYRYIATADLGAFEILKTSHKGINDIRNYHHMSAEDGILQRYEFDGKEFQPKESRNIKGKDLDSYIKEEKVTLEYFTKDLQKTTPEELWKEIEKK